MKQVVLLLTLVSTFAAAPARAADVEGTVAPDRATVVVLEPRAGPTPARSPRRVSMDQKNLAFVPFVLPITRGDTITFTNSDDVQHNVFSPSASAGKFDLGTYGPGATRAVTFDQVGEVVILCNIHMEMEGHVLVVDTPYYATPTPDGRFHIADVPAGAYVVRIWRGRWLPSERALEVPASGTATVDLTSGG